MPPVIWPPARNMAGDSVSGVTETTPGTSLIRFTVASRSGEVSTGPCTYICPLNDSIRPSSSLRKPAMMLITLISTATASMMPMKLMMAIRATPPSLRLARR
ncbi:hypothetical protein D3C81_1607270 [compost metagenome]